jgi:hypothetical protein
MIHAVAFYKIKMENGLNESTIPATWDGGSRKGVFGGFGGIER